MLSGVVLGWVAATSSVAAWAAIRPRPKRAPPRGPAPSVVLLRPCSGGEADLEHALTSSGVVGPSGVVRFLLANASDTALPAAMRAQRTLQERGLDASIVFTGCTGPNRKADQLARGLGTLGAAAEIIVAADSDVMLTQDAVAAVTEPVASGTADAMWAPPVEGPSSTMADAASRAVLDSSLHSFSLLSALDPRGMVGKLVAIRSEALARVGGFGGLTAYLGEDMELARRLRAAGLRVAASAVPAACAPGRRSWRQTLGRYARWIAVIRAQRPALLATYPLLIAAAPLQLGLALLALVTEKAGALPALLAVVGGRWVVAAAARWRSERRLSPASTAWLADVVLLAAWLRAMVSPSVTWRGVQFRVRPGGMLTEVAR